MPKPVQVFRCIDAQHEDFSTFDKIDPTPRQFVTATALRRNTGRLKRKPVHNSTSTRRSPTTRPVTTRPLSKRTLTFCPSRPAAMACPSPATA